MSPALVAVADKSRLTSAQDQRIPIHLGETRALCISQVDRRNVASGPASTGRKKSCKPGMRCGFYRHVSSASQSFSTKTLVECV